MSGQWRDPDEDLLARLNRSHLYWASGGRDGAPLVAVNEDLSRVDLYERRLADARLQGCNLAGANLAQADLSGAALDGAVLQRAELFAADLTRTTCTDALIDESTARRSRWRKALLTRARLRGADLVDADFREAELVDADLRDASCASADFRYASLARANLRGADVRGAHVDGAVVSPITLSAARNQDAVVGQPVLAAGSREGRSDDRAESELRATVLTTLRRFKREVHVIDVDGSLPAFVLERTDRNFIAIDLLMRSEAGFPSIVASRADVAVKSEDLGVAPQIQIPVVRPEQLSNWLSTDGQAIKSGHGGTALAVRQTVRVRPWMVFARHAERDPSFVSRFAVWLDERNDFLLTSRDRPLTSLVPAAVDGAGWARGVRWAVSRLDDLSTFETRTRQLWRAFVRPVDEARALAQKGLAFELEVAEVVDEDSSTS
jgi:uncharacterized protein YjbI with pentapeptide repeats